MASEERSRFKYVDAADQFLRKHGAPLAFWANDYWEFTGTHYRNLGSYNDLQLLIDQWLMADEGDCTLPISNFTVGEIERRCRARCFLAKDQAMPARIGESVKHPACAVLQNGVLDLDPCKDDDDPVLLPHSEMWFSTGALPYEYDPAATCPMWEKFLTDCLQGDQQRINLLQEWFGYCCTYDTSYEKALFMEGPGGNGKSQAMEVLRQLVGVSNVSSIPLHKLDERFQTYGLHGKLINICSESDAGARVPVATLRHLITGDDFQFERKGIDTFSAKPTARFVISMNQRPTFADPSNALWRRILLMPWTYSVPKDKIVLDLGRKMAKAELPGIFNWAVAGLRRLWKQGHFTESTVVQAATDSLRAQSDPIRNYLLDHYELVPGNVFLKDDLWKECLTAATRGELTLPRDYTAVRFALDVQRVFVSIAEGRRRIGGTNRRVWENLKRKEE